MSHPGNRKGARLIAALIGIATGTVAAMVMAGWAFGIAPLTSVYPGWPAMVPGTALGLLLASISLLLLARRASPGSDAGRYGAAATICASLAMLIGILRLLEITTGARWNVGFLGARAAAAGSMSPATAAEFVLLGAALLLLSLRRLPRTGQVLALATLLIAWLGVSRFVYGGAPLAVLAAMAVHTALSFALLSLGALAAAEPVGLLRLVASLMPGASSARQLLAAALLLPLVLAWLALAAVHALWIGNEVALALFALTMAMALALLVAIHAARLDRAGQERQRALDELSQSEERTRLVLEGALDAVVTIERDGTISGWNSQAAAIFGWTRDEVLGRELATVIVPERLAEAHRMGLRRYLDTGESRVLDRRVELTAVRRSGEEFPVEIAITPIHGRSGIAFCAFLRDITERRKAIERMHLLDRSTRAIAERQDLRSIQQSVLGSLEKGFAVDFACVCKYDAADHCLVVSCIGSASHRHAAARALPEESRIDVDSCGLAACVAGQLVHEPDLAVVASSFAGQLREAGLGTLVVAPIAVENRLFGVLVAARTATGSFSSGDCEFLRQLSEHVGLAAHQAELYSNLHNAYEDLRRTQRAVMQQERLRVIGQMASGIAHDINNALSPAAIYLQSMQERESGLSEASRKQLRVIEEAIQGVASTIGRLREFYRDTESVAVLSAVSPNAEIQQSIELTRARWHDIPMQRGNVIELVNELSPDVPAVVAAPGEIRDAVTNLIVNAVDAMPEGGRLTLRSRLLDGGDEVEIAVEDTGAGMDEQTRARCLEPFFSTKGERGTGLGLAMVHGLIERQGGRIEIDSEPGRGTIMKMFLPISKFAAPEVDGTAHGALTPQQILIVDDDSILLTSLSEILKGDGHHVTAADGGQAGIDALHASVAEGRPYSIVITDLGMPRIDGRAVAAAAKTSSPGIGVILLTGWGQRLAADRDVPPNVDKVLPKPPRLADLRSAIAALAG